MRVLSTSKRYTTANFARFVMRALRSTVCTSVGAFVESLSWRQGDLLATPDPLDDQRFQQVEQGVRIVSMDMFHSSGGIVDCYRQHLSPGHIGGILPREWG